MLVCFFTSTKKAALAARCNLHCWEGPDHLQQAERCIKSAALQECMMNTLCHLVSWIAADWQSQHHRRMLHISAINNGPSDFFWKPVKLCMAAVLMIWCMFTGHFRVGCCELPICKPLVANISTRSCVLLFCLGKYYASTASSMKFYWSVLTSYRYFWGSQLLWGVESPLTSEVMLECMDQLCLSALTSFTCIQVHDCCIVLRVGWPVKSCSAVLTSFTCFQVHDCCLVWRVIRPVKSCVSALTSFTCCQAHNCCLGWSHLTSEVLLECTDQLYMLSGSRLLSGVESQLAIEVLLKYTDQLYMLSGSRLLSCIDESVDQWSLVLSVLTSFTCCQAHDCCLVWREG